jgi:hypothetical protein
MRKITILEVLDPVKNEFIPIRQAINQNLFNTKTYLFYNPVEDKNYSISEAAQKGFLKSAIDLRPEALIVERIKIAETVSLLAARDPDIDYKFINITDAIKKGIVDTNLKIYRNVASNEVVDLSNAIEKDLIKVEIVRETTEKITETLTEQKTADNFGIIKKIEQQTSTTDDSFDMAAEANQDSTKIKEINGLYVFDRTKSFNVNKQLRKYDDDIAAGFITDSNSEKIIAQSSTNLKSILKTKSPVSPIIDLNEAIQKNVVILPDSLYLTQNVQYVLDLSTGDRVDFDTACDMGIIDVRSKKFYDTRNGESLPLFEALGRNFIIMKDELNNNYDEDEPDYYPVLTNDSKRLTKDDIKSVFSPNSGSQVSVEKAISLGLLNEKLNVYIDVMTSRRMTLEDASKKGMIVLKPEKIQTELNEGYQFLHIKGVKNPVTNKEMTLNQAIQDGFLDYTECEFHDPSSQKPLTLLEAYDKGFLITAEKYADTERKVTESKPNKATSKTERTITPSTSHTTTATATKAMPYSSTDDDIPIAQPKQTQSSKPKLTSSMSMRSMAKSHSPFRNSKQLRASSYELKSNDRYSISSSKSVMVRLKEKLFGKKTKSNLFDESLIQFSMRINDTANKKKLSLQEAIRSNVVVPEDRVLDTLNDASYSIGEAIEKGIIQFFHPVNKFEFKYGQSCFMFDDVFLLVNFVLDPVSHKKIGLKSAFQRAIIDKDNGLYMGKKTPLPLQTAIEKGLISCEIIEMYLLNAVITSNVFKHSSYQTDKQPSVVVAEPKGKETEKSAKDYKKKVILKNFFFFYKTKHRI